MITTRFRKRILLAVNAVLAVAVAAACSIALAPVEADESRLLKDRPTPAALRVEQRQLLAPEAYAVIYKTDLHQPLFDKPKVVVAATQVAPAVVPVHLVGTILEKGFCYAMLKRTGGETKMLAVGESADGVGTA